MADETKIVISAETAQAESALISLNRSVDGAAKSLLSFSGIAGALSVGAFAAFVKKGIDAADELSVLAEKTGSTVEALAGLKFAAEQNDASLESVAKGAQKLSAAMVDKPQLFAQFGVTAKDTTGAMVQLADVFATMPDGVEKNALATKIFGDRLGGEMIPFLNQGSEALAGYVAEGQKVYPITTENAKAARQFNDDIAKMGAQISGVAMVIGADLVPAFNWVMNDAIKPFIGGIKILGVELAQFIQETMLGIERLTSPSTWGKEGTEQYRARLKELARIAEEEKMAIAASMEGIGAATSTGAPAASGNGRKLQKALDGGDDKEAEKAAREQAKIDAEIERQQGKYAKLNEMAVLADATEEERISWKMGFDLSNMEKEKQDAIAHKAWNADLEASYQQARLNRTAIAESEIGKLKKKAAEQQAKEGQQITQQNFAVLGEKYRVFFELQKVGAISEIMIAGGPRAEKSAEWAASFGPGAAAAATVISWAATAVNAANVASMKFGGGASVSGAGGMPSVSSSVMTPSTPVSVAPSSAPSSSSGLQPAEQRTTIHLNGTIFDQQTVRDLIGQMNEAVRDGVQFDVVMG